MLRRLFGLPSASLFVFVPLTVLAQGMMGNQYNTPLQNGMMGMLGNGGFGWGVMGLFGWAWSILATIVLVLLVWLLWILIQRFGK